MSILQASQTPVFSLTNIIRVLTQSSIALGITFAIFVIMHTLISNPNTKIIESPPFTSINMLFESQDKAVETRKPMPPKPELQALPEIQNIQPAAVKSTGFSTKPNVNLPQIRPSAEFSLGEIDRELTPIVRESPRYPPAAARDGIEGYVVLSFSILPSGAVDNIRVIQSEPRSVFNAAAKKALRKWKYQPQMRDGKAITVNGQQVRLDFKLSQ